MNYIKVSNDTSVAGVVVTDTTSTSKKSRKARKALRENHTTKTKLASAVSASRHITDEILESLVAEQEMELRESLSTGQALQTLVEQTKSELQESLNQSHDFLQLVKQIRAHVITILELNHPGTRPEQAAEKMSEEGAIYFSTELMIGKIDATIFLNEPNRAFGAEGEFEIHKFITKYYRIYRSQAKQKDVDILLVGRCHGKTRYNSAAIGTVVHALLDNLVKYAPPGSNAEIIFEERPQDIDVSFSSLGPRIEEEEFSSIFLPGHRSKMAKETSSSGLGLGLAAAKTISDMLELDLRVHQDADPDKKFSTYYETTFSFTLEKI